MTSHLEAILGRLLELERAATPGPWRFVQEGRGQFDLLPSDGESSFGTLWCDAPGSAEADAALVCTLRNAVPELLSLVDRCRAAEMEADRLRFEVKLYRERWQHALEAFEELDPLQSPHWPEMTDRPTPSRNEQPVLTQIS